MYIDKTIAIAILARDCEKSLPNNIQKIERLRRHFKDSIVIVVENDSIDQTKNILADWQKNAQNVVIMSEDYNEKTIPDKTAECPLPAMSRYRNEKMSFFRNKYLDYLRKLDTEFDYLMIIDIDIDDFDENSIISVIMNAPSDWTALFANGFKYIKFIGKINIGYYDSYPLIFYTKNGNKIVTEKTFIELNEDIHKIEKEIKKNKFVKCVSAFGGIGIYKYKYIRDNCYSTGPNNRSSIIEAISEHVSLNYDLHKKKVGTNYIASEMYVYYEQVKNLIQILCTFLPFRLYIYIWETIKRKKFPV